MQKKMKIQRKSEQELQARLSQLNWAVTMETCTPGLYMVTVTNVESGLTSVAEKPTREEALRHLASVLGQ